jgi:hypothetical protein
LIDSAVDQYAVENNKTSGATVGMADWTQYLKSGSVFYNTGADLFGESYGSQTVDTLPNVPATSWSTLSTLPARISSHPMGILGVRAREFEIFFD